MTKKIVKTKEPKTKGRKWFDGKDEQTVLSKLKEVWALGGSDAEASFYAEISPGALSRYMSANPDVKDIRNALHEKPILKARQTIINNLNNLQGATWYLERKRKAEFSTRSELTGANGKALVPAERKQEIDQALKDVL